MIFMHSRVYVFIPAEGDLDSEVAKALEPFDEENTVAAYKVYLTPEEIEAMAERLDLKSTELAKLATRMKRRRGLPGGVDDRGLFFISNANPQGKWDWYEIGGCWHGLLPDNIGAARTMLDQNDFSLSLPAKFIDGHGLWHEQENYVASGSRPGSTVAKSESVWRAEFRAALKAAPDSRIVCVDMHS